MSCQVDNGLCRLEAWVWSFRMWGAQYVFQSCYLLLIYIIYVMLACQTNPHIKIDRFAHRKNKSEEEKNRKHAEHFLRTTKVSGVKRASIKDVQTSLFWGLGIMCMSISVRNVCANYCP